MHACMRVYFYVNIGYVHAYARHKDMDMHRHHTICWYCYICKYVDAFPPQDCVDSFVRNRGLGSTTGRDPPSYPGGSWIEDPAGTFTWEAEDSNKYKISNDVVVFRRKSVEALSREGTR